MARVGQLKKKFVKRIRQLDPIGYEFIQGRMANICAVSEDLYSSFAYDIFGKKFVDYSNLIFDFFNKDLPSVGISYDLKTTKPTQMMVFILDEFFPNRYQEHYNKI